MEITFTKEQYESLLKLVYLGNWMINSARTDDYVKKYEDMEDYILSFAKVPGLDKYIEYDEKSERYYPSLALGEDAEIEQYIDDYNDEIFWDELMHRLARRDLIEAYGEDSVRKMPHEELLEKEHPFIEKYIDAFENHGIENLIIGK